MSNGYNKNKTYVSFCTPAGEMRVCSHMNEYILNHMKKTLITEYGLDSYRYYTQTQQPLTFDGPGEIPYPVNSGYEENIAVLTELPEINHSKPLNNKDMKLLDELLNTRLGEVDIHSTMKQVAEYEVQEAIKPHVAKFATEKLFSIISKRKPEFFKKDLDTDSIWELCNKYLENFGSPDLVAFNARLGTNQKFFIITDEEAIQAFMSRDHSAYRAPGEYNKMQISIGLKMAVEEIIPNKWVSGRYEEQTYLRELAQNTRYTSI